MPESYSSYGLSTSSAWGPLPSESRLDPKAMCTDLPASSGFQEHFLGSHRYECGHRTSLPACCLQSFTYQQVEYLSCVLWRVQDWDLGMASTMGACPTKLFPSHGSTLPLSDAKYKIPAIHGCRRAWDAPDL